MTLDPLSTNHKNNHKSPLTLDYKYDKQRKKKGLDSWEQKLRRMRTRESKSDKEGESEKQVCWVLV